jgi:DNA polymerase III epsilon subunit-like protein
MPFVLYDLETTGLNPRYDQPVQFAAVRLDDDLQEKDAIELLGRPQNHILPSPGALLTHGRGIQTILEAPLSHYQLMAAIEAQAAAWGQATWTGYNSIRFDEEFLRHSHYCALRQPYMTQFNGNGRGDVMRLAQLAGALDPGTLRDEAVLDRMAARLKARPEILERRRKIVEHPFGSIKQWMNQGAFLMKGLNKVRAEFSLTALAYNLRCALNILGVEAMTAAVRA